MASRIVLVAEDETLSQRLVTAVIQYCGLTAKIVSNGQECLNLLSGGLEPELILLDLEMPVMNGIQVLEAMKIFNPEDRCPIVVFTANNQESTVLEAIKLGADDFVVKPFKTNDLAQRIKDLTFEVNEQDLKNMINNLHVQDHRLHDIPSLHKKVGNAYDLYPISSQDKKMCIGIPRGQAPQIVAKMNLKDLSHQTAIYRKCTFGWSKVWPRSAKLLKQLKPAI